MQYAGLTEQAKESLQVTIAGERWMQGNWTGFIVVLRDVQHNIKHVAVFSA